MVIVSVQLARLVGVMFRVSGVADGRVTVLACFVMLAVVVRFGRSTVMLGGLIVMISGLGMVFAHLRCIFHDRSFVAVAPVQSGYLLPMTVRRAERALCLRELRLPRDGRLLTARSTGTEAWLPAGCREPRVSRTFDELSAIDQKLLREKRESALWHYANDPATSLDASSAKRRVWASKLMTSLVFKIELA